MDSLLKLFCDVDDFCTTFLPLANGMRSLKDEMPLPLPDVHFNPGKVLREGICGDH
jgi:hypothetical protein